MDLDQMDVDIEFDLHSNPIKDFLLAKLKDLRYQNEKLKDHVSKKTELIAEHLQNTAFNPDAPIIAKTWKRIFYDYYVIGYKVTNPASHLSLKIANVLLNWDASSPITYKLKVFQTSEESDWFEYCSKSAIVRKNGILILVIEKPNFLKQTSFKINGILVYKIASAEYQLNIPEFTIDVNDFCDILMELRASELLRANLEDLLVLYASCERYELTGEINSFVTKDLTTVFGSDCMFREITLKNKKLFLVDGLSTSLNGSILEILSREENKFSLTIMCKNEEIMIQLLHYLYRNVSGIQIFPRIEERNDSSLSEALLQEISIIEELCSRQDRDKKLEDVSKLRDELNRAQYESDKIYCLNKV